MKKEFEKPIIIELGTLEEVTGEGGHNNDDGWGFSITAGPGNSWADP